MAQYTETVNAIRSILGSANQARDANLEKRAREYIEACRTVSLRLQRCQDFLNRGLRAEALHYAQTPPDLLDAVAVLDFAEAPHWADLTAMYGLPPIPALNRATAAALNEAFAVQQTLEPHLRSLRRLALAHAPLEKRVAALWKLAELDPDNSVWTDAIGDVEKQRLEKLQADVSEAIAASDITALQTLQTELEGPWIAGEPDPALLKRVKEALRRLAGDQKRAAFGQLTREVLEAYARRDPALTRTLLAQWTEAAEDLRVRSSDTSYQQLNPVRTWLERERRKEEQQAEFEQALLELEYAIQNDSSVEALADSWQRVRALGLPIPPAVEQQYQAALSRVQTLAVTRKRLLIGAAVFFTLLLGATSWLYVAYRANERRYEAALEALRESINEEKAEAARQILERLRGENDWMLQRPEMVQQQGRLDALVREETYRTAELAKALKELDEEPPDAPATVARATAERLARHSQEKLALANTLTRRKARRDDLQLARDLEYDKDMKAVNAELRAIAVRLADPDNLQKLQHLKVRVEQLNDKSKLVSPTLAGSHNPMLKQLADLETKVQKRQEEERAFQGVLGCAEREFLPESYESALAAYLRLAPDSQRGQDFGRALKSLAAARGVLAWRELVERFGADLWPRSAEGLAQRERELQEHVSTHGSQPAHALVRKYQECVARSPFKEYPELRAVFKDSLVAKLYQAQGEQDKTYYLFDQPQLHGNADPEKLVRAYVIIGNDFDPVSKRSMKFEKVRPSSLKKSPQALLAQAILERPAADFYNQWETSTVRVLTEIVNETRMDPVVRLILVRKVLNRAARGSVFLEHALSEHLAHVARAIVDLNVPWMNPDASEGNYARKAAQQVLKDLPDLTGVVRRAQEEKASLEGELRASGAVPYGLLYRPAPNEWRLSTERALPGSNLLCILRFTASGETTTWLPIGSYDGKLRLDSIPATNVPEGTLVFARPAPKAE